MKTKVDKLSFLHNLNKEVDLHELLEELLPEMGFKDVKITHEKGNRPEFGKDLVCSQFDNIESKKDWVAFVVKKGTIAGNSSAIKEIKDQVAECFEFPYESIEQKGKISINKVKVVTNEHFSGGAKDKILKGNLLEKANVDFWDDEKLVHFIDSHYKKFWIRGSKEYKKYIERINERIKTDTSLKSLSIEEKRVEKLLKNVIETKLTERITNEDGSISWKKRSVDTVIDVPNNSLIIGEPGSGKTTLFKTLSTEIIAQNSIRNNYEFYPIILTFKEIESNDFDVEKTLEFFFKKDWLNDLNIDHLNILENENCVIFIDALDELPKIDSKEKALTAISDFSQLHPNIKVICSSRPSDYLFHNCEVEGFRYLEICDLSKQQIELFFSNYFADNLIKSQSLLKTLRDSEILEKLPKTPLTIALVTILFDEKEIEIPATISDLYQNFVNLLIGKVTPKGTVDLIEIGIKHRLLCYLAKEMHENLQNSVSLEELNDIIDSYSKARGQKIETKPLIEELIDRVGLLYINNKDEISFKHQSFQEYFTAYEIFHHRPSDQNLFTENFNDLWWQNVAIFYAGMSKDSPILIDEILKNSKPRTLPEYITNTGGLGRLLQAVYNTPIEYRIKGIERGLTNTVEVLKLIENDDSNISEFLKNFSKFGLMQIFGSWFQFNNWSVTLIEPLAQSFDASVTNLDYDILNDEEIFELEFKLFLSSTILASDDFLDFDRLEILVEKSKFIDINLIAIFDTHIKYLKKKIPKVFKNEAKLKKIEKRITKKVKSVSSFADDVNIPLNKLEDKE